MNCVSVSQIALKISGTKTGFCALFLIQICLVIGCTSAPKEVYAPTEKIPIGTRDGSFSGLVWKPNHDGPDFSVGYAHLRDDPTTEVVLYVGFHPDVGIGRLVSGKLGDFRGTWIVRDGFYPQFSREFVGLPKRNRAVMHARISSESKENLDLAIAELSKLNIFSAEFEKWSEKEARRVIDSMRREARVHEAE
jgi:hypothetical protein